MPVFPVMLITLPFFTMRPAQRKLLAFKQLKARLVWGERVKISFPQTVGMILPSSKSVKD